MIESPPGFFADFRRFGLGFAFKKRFGTFDLGGQRVSYSAMRRMPDRQRLELLRQAAATGDDVLVCVVFEAHSLAADADSRQLWPPLLTYFAADLGVAQLVLRPVLARYLDDPSEIDPKQMPPSMVEPFARLAAATALTARKAMVKVACASAAQRCLETLDTERLEQLLLRSAKDGDGQLRELVYAALKTRLGGDARTLAPRVLTMVGNDEQLAGALVPVLLGHESADALKSVELSARGSYLLGKGYSDLAFAAKGSSKDSLQTNKKLALHHLGQAREKCTHHAHEADVDPYRAAAIAAALTASVAAAYEAAAYLQWKGTRTTALAE